MAIKRSLCTALEEWEKSKQRKSLILRGARQVGKTHLIRTFGEKFENFIEINFERQPKVKQVFEQDLDVHRIIRDLSLLLAKPISTENTLLFFDEIQEAPLAITALRYFYEEMPQLRVVAAGSLLDFALEKIGVPVGRVQFLYLYPLSFIEFLRALQENLLADEILSYEPSRPFSEPVHQRALRLLAEYHAVGGMPEVVQSWKEQKDLVACAAIHQQLIDAYQQDFQKYARKHQIKYVDLLFKNIPHHLGQSFKYAAIGEHYRKRELAPSLELLEKAGIVHSVVQSAAQGLPLGGQAHPNRFKLILLDVALAQTLLGLPSAPWVLEPEKTLINKGPISEAFVGQELLAYAPSHAPQHLYYWHRESPSSNAEVDYLTTRNDLILPVEVKSGKGTSLKSLYRFLAEHPTSPYGIRFSIQNGSVMDKLHSYPLYAVASLQRNTR